MRRTDAGHRNAPTRLSRGGFEMVIKQTEPDVDVWKEQQECRRRSNRNRMSGVLGLAAAIVVLAVILLVRAIGDGSETRSDGTETQPEVTPTEAAEGPAEPAIQPLPGGSLDPGRYVFTSYDPRLDASHRITMEVPDGYQGFEGWAALKAGTSQTAASTLAIGGVYANPCRWESTLLDRSAISSTDELAAALANQKGFRVSTPTDVTVVGFAGTYVERRVLAQDFSECDGGQFRVYFDAGRGPDGGERYLSPRGLQYLWILDIDGVPLVIEASLDEGMSPQVRDELIQTAESIRIDPIEP